MKMNAYMVKSCSGVLTIISKHLENDGRPSLGRV